MKLLKIDILQKHKGLEKIEYGKYYIRNKFSNFSQNSLVEKKRKTGYFSYIFFLF